MNPHTITAKDIQVGDTIEVESEHNGGLHRSRYTVGDVAPWHGDGPGDVSVTPSGGRYGYVYASDWTVTLLDRPEPEQPSQPDEPADLLATAHVAGRHFIRKSTRHARPWGEIEWFEGHDGNFDNCWGFGLVSSRYDWDHLTALGLVSVQPERLTEDEWRVKHGPEIVQTAKAEICEMIGAEPIEGADLDCLANDQWCQLEADRNKWRRKALKQRNRAKRARKQLGAMNALNHCVPATGRTGRRAGEDR